MDSTLIDELMDRRELTEIYRDEFNEGRLRGFFCGLSTELVLVVAVNEDMQDAGYTIIRLEDITDLCWGKACHKHLTRSIEPVWLNDPQIKSIDLQTWRTAGQSHLTLGSE